MISALALAPILLFFILVVGLRRPVFESALAAFASIAAVGMLWWGMDAARVASAAGKGFLVATEIAFVVFGALLIVELLREKGLMSFLKSLFEWVSRDERVHVVLIAWGLVYFIEGVAGFGTPALVAVPILLALGYPALTAVSLALIGDSVPVIFGAIGLPVTYGIGSALQAIGAGEEVMATLPVLIANLNVIGSVFVPLALVLSFCVLEKKPVRHFLEFVPFALVSGLAAAVASIATVVIVGPELPSVFGGITAIAVVSFMARKGVLLPKTEHAEKLPLAPDIGHHRRQILKAVTPYAVLVSLLVVSRLPFLPVKGFLTQAAELRIPALFSWPIEYSFAPFYSAGFLILVSAIIFACVIRITAQEAGTVLRSTVLRIWKPYVALIAVVAFVQVFIYSGDNALGMPSMPTILAQGASGILGPLWPLVAPFVGALGAFAAGSATVSNLIFTGIQYETAIASHFDPALILALQGLGAAAGNMIALHNVIAALTVAGIAGKESLIVRRNFIPLCIYLIIVGLVGLIIAAR